MTDRETWIARLKMAGIILVCGVVVISVLYFLEVAGESVITTINSSKTSPSSTVPQAMDKIATALKWIALAIALQLTRK